MSLVKRLTRPRDSRKEEVRRHQMMGYFLRFARKGSVAIKSVEMRGLDRIVSPDEIGVDVPIDNVPELRLILTEDMVFEDCVYAGIMEDGERVIGRIVHKFEVFGVVINVVGSALEILGEVDRPYHDMEYVTSTIFGEEGGILAQTIDLFIENRSLEYRDMIMDESLRRLIFRRTREVYGTDFLKCLYWFELIVKELVRTTLTRHDKEMDEKLAYLVVQALSPFPYIRYVLNNATKKRSQIAIGPLDVRKQIREDEGSELIRKVGVVEANRILETLEMPSVETLFPSLEVLKLREGIFGEGFGN